VNRKLITLLISVCVVLLLIIFAEWLYARKAQQELIASTSAAVKKNPPDAMPTVELTKQPEESFDQMVARPLFLKGRRPVDEPKAEDAQTPAVVLVFDWELNGIYTRNNSLSAFFSRAKTKVPHDNYRKLMVGGDLDGWKLTEISKDKVILMQGGNQKELMLRKPKPKQPVLPNARLMPPGPQPVPSPVPTPESIPNPELISPAESPEEQFENNTDE